MVWARFIAFTRPKRDQCIDDRCILWCWHRQAKNFFWLNRYSPVLRFIYLSSWSKWSRERCFCSQVWQTIMFLQFLLRCPFVKHEKHNPFESRNSKIMLLNFFFFFFKGCSPLQNRCEAGKESGRLEVLLTVDGDVLDVATAKSVTWGAKSAYCLWFIIWYFGTLESFNTAVTLKSLNNGSGVIFACFGYEFSSNTAFSRMSRAAVPHYPWVAFRGIISGLMEYPVPPLHVHFTLHCSNLLRKVHLHVRLDFVLFLYWDSFLHGGIGDFDIINKVFLGCRQLWMTVTVWEKKLLCLDYSQVGEILSC